MTNRVIQNTDNKPYDLVIIGSGLQASLLLAQAAYKDLNAILVSENDCAENLGEIPIQLIDSSISFQFWKVLYRYNLVENLKKSFLHLFIFTKVDNFHPTNIIKRIIIFINKLIFNKITETGKTKSCDYHYYSTQTYKFSIARMSVSLLQKAVELGAKIHSYSQIKSIDHLDNKLYNIEIETFSDNQPITLVCRNILSFYPDKVQVKLNHHKRANKNHLISWFTYPTLKLKVERNRILKTESQCLKLITWFDHLYFEFYDSRSMNISLTEVLLFMKNHFTDIQIDESLIQNSGSFIKLSEKENKSQIQAIYFDGKGQVELNYKPVEQWFKYSNTICNKIVTNVGNGTKGSSVIGRIIFAGSDLPNSDNPLRIMEFADEKYDQAKQILKSPVYFKKLFYRYGSDIEQIIEKAYENWNRNKDSKYAWLKAEIEYSVENEFCINAQDFINLRTELWMEADSSTTAEIEKIFKELL